MHVSMSALQSIRSFETCHVVLLVLMFADVLVCSRIDDIYADLPQVRRDSACILSHQALTTLLEGLLQAPLLSEHEGKKRSRSLSVSAMTHLCINVVLEV